MRTRRSSRTRHLALQVDGEGVKGATGTRRTLDSLLPHAGQGHFCPGPHRPQHLPHPHSQSSQLGIGLSLSGVAGRNGGCRGGIKNQLKTSSVSG